MRGLLVGYGGWGEGKGAEPGVGYGVVARLGMCLGWDAATRCLQAETCWKSSVLGFWTVLARLEWRKMVLARLEGKGWCVLLVISFRSVVVLDSDAWSFVLGCLQLVPGRPSWSVAVFVCSCCLFVCDVMCSFDV